MNNVPMWPSFSLCPLSPLASQHPGASVIEGAMAEDPAGLGDPLLCRRVTDLLVL